MDKIQDRDINETKYDAGRLVRGLLPKLLFALAGYLTGLAALPFGAAPFGIALLCAADRNALFVWLGLGVSAFTAFDETKALTFFGIYTAALLLRALVRFTLDSPYRKKDGKRSVGELLSVLFSEAPAYRVSTAAVGAFALGTCLLIGGGFLYYDLFALVISTVLSPFAAFVFNGYFTKKGLARQIAFLAIAAVCVLGAADIKLYGVSAAAFIAICVTFFAAIKKGVLSGAVAGLVLGVVYSPTLSPAFVLCALCIGVFMKISPTLAFSSAFLASAAWGFYDKGIYALDGFFGAAISACLLSSAAYKLFSKKKTEQKSAERCQVLFEGELDGIRLFDMNRRISAMSEGFEKLSGFIEEMRSRFPNAAELAKICEDAFESSCASCPNRLECRDKVNTRAESERLSLLLSKSRGVEARDLSGELAALCGRLPDILDEINYNAGVRIKGEGEPSLPDYNYKALSKLIEKSASADGEEYTVDRELSSSLCEPLSALDIGIVGVLAYGKRKKTVYIRAKALETLEDNKEAILDTLRASLRFAIDEKSLSLRKCAGGGALSVSEAERMSVTLVSRTKRAENELSFCGDSLCAFKNSDNRFFSLISDGMGSGREAAEVSEICARFMEGMLSVGSMNEELLGLLNGFLCSRSENSLHECSATVDLMELDLINGKAVFFKSGAAPTYLFRSGSLFKLRSRTMPIGILANADTKRFEFELSEGDTVIMMSDGITGGHEECPWLFDLLRQNIDSSGLERTADLILKYAVGHGSEDDISLAIIRVNGVS